MEYFHLNSNTIYQALADKGIEYLYHANTLLTSLTFIKQNALVSRAFVERTNLIQTDQKSDKEDKEYNVWDDVFLDGIDLHKKYKRSNKYGPVLFVLKLELLQAPSLPPLLITKSNPWYWKNYPNWEDRYYANPEEVTNRYLVPGHLDSQIMFTLRSPELFIKLNKYLRGIIIDRPTLLIDFKTGERKNIGDHAHEQIRQTLDGNSLGHIPIKFRHANDNFHLCRCNYEYNWMNAWNFKEFFKKYRSQ